MAKLYLIRGSMVVAIGFVIVMLGAGLFDSSYNFVEPILQNKSVIMANQEILPNQFANMTIQSNQLDEHNVIIMHIKPSSSSAKLEGIEPNGLTFEKESRLGFLYHIIHRNDQGGTYYIKISNLESKPLKIDLILGGDPFLSKNCDLGIWIKCNVVYTSMILVATGIITSFVGLLIAIYDLRSEKNFKQNKTFKKILIFLLKFSKSK